MNLAARVDAGQGDADARAAVIDDRGGLHRGSHIAGYPGAQRAHHRFRIFDAGTFADIGDVRHLDRSIFLLGGLRWHGATLILDRDMRHGVDELPQEIDLRILVPSARSVRAGESTDVPLDTSPMISMLRLPRMPTFTDTRLIRPSSTI